MTKCAKVAGVLLAMTGMPAHGAGAPKSPVLQALADCAQQRDASRRLACYDEKVVALTEAEKTGEVVITDRADIREAQQASLGLRSRPVPGSEASTPVRITAKIQSVRPFTYGRWLFMLDNGMRWRQADDEAIFPKAGQDVTIQAASMGGYTMKIGSSLVRVSRVS